MQAMHFGRVWAEIDLDVLDANIAAVRSVLGGRRLLLAVKADAYGHGLREVGAAAADSVDVLGVASVEEGASLRLAGVRTPVLVLSPIPYGEIPGLFDHGLTPSVTEPEFARLLSAEAARRTTTVGFHVEVDTGMGRTGVDADRAFGLITGTARLPGLRLEGVFTHFPAADSDISFSEGQLREFHALVERLRGAGLKDFLAHSANTAALLNIADSGLDLVRPGLLAYGILPDSYALGRRTTSVEVRPVMRLRSRIVNLRRVAAGRSVSYERAWFTRRDSRIAVITAGYGDGYPWSMKDRGLALVRGRRVPIVGNVCMDLTMLDVTDVPEASIDDRVTLLGADGGETITANELATRAETIPYEIICRVSPRVPRVYLRGGKVTKVRNLLNHD
jgi:alanine racemase